MKKMLHTIQRLLNKKGSLSSREIRETLMSSGLFQTDWYSKRYPEVFKNSNSALEHYIEVGEKEGKWPNPFFDPEWYKGQTPSAEKFEGPAILHYALHGWHRSKDPSRHFCTSFYLDQYPEVKKAGICPLQHYLNVGVYTGKAAFPRILKKDDQGLKLVSEIRLIAESGLFISDWYKAQNPTYWDKGQTIDPVHHYVTNGHHYNCDPNPIFNTAWYRQIHTKSVGSENPLVHYIRDGYEKGFQAAPNFCTKTYFKAHNKLDPKNTNALKHYLENGYGQGERRPEPPLETRKIQKPSSSAKLPISKGLRGLIDYKKCDLNPKSNTFNGTSLMIHWVIPDFAAGGGGHMTIFRMTHFLERMGHKQTIWIHDPSAHQNEIDAHDDILKHFQQFSGKVKFLDDRFSHAKGDALIATDCWTVWPVLSASNFKRRFYFVQDFEPAFHPLGAQSLAAEQTYHEDLDCICASPWLEKLMREKYGRWARSFWLAADTKTYFPVSKKQENKRPRIAFYARHFTARRAVELGMLALEELAKTGIEFEVDFFGAALNFQKAPFAFRDHGVASHDELARIFQKADVGVVFSATNYSLVPQEMMACSLPIVELDGESTRAIFPEDTVTLAKPHPSNIAGAIEALISNPAKRRKQAKAALEWVRGFSWEQSAGLVENAIKDRLSELFTEKIQPVPKTSTHTATGIKASVIIPTLNAGPEFAKVLDATVNQKTDWPFEILVIDSGSTDETLDIVSKHPMVRLRQIDKKDFNHGGTRNLGAKLTTGDFIAYLTHDALPANDRWLHNLVTAIERFPNAAGAFGKHLAYPDASAYTQRDLDAHFNAMNQHSLYVSKDTNLVWYESNDNGWRQFLHFYSDNNSCMRRSVWEKIPYRPIKYGEDQVWADDIIKAGYGKVYAVQAVVYHSHDFDEAENYDRNKTEAAFFKHFFGYTLIKNEAAMVKALEDQNAYDEKWGKGHKLPKAEITARKAQNKSRFQGYLDGYQADTATMF